MTHPTTTDFYAFAAARAALLIAERDPTRDYLTLLRTNLAAARAKIGQPYSPGFNWPAYARALDISQV